MLKIQNNESLVSKEKNYKLTSFYRLRNVTDNSNKTSWCRQSRRDATITASPFQKRMDKGGSDKRTGEMEAGGEEGHYGACSLKIPGYLSVTWLTLSCQSSLVGKWREGRGGEREGGMDGGPLGTVRNGAVGGAITAAVFFHLIKERGRNETVISHSPPPGKKPTNDMRISGFAWFTHAPFAVRTRSVCVPYAVQKQHGLIVLSHRTRLQSAPDPRLFTTDTTFIHYFDFKS